MDLVNFTNLTAGFTSDTFMKEKLKAEECLSSTMVPTIKENSLTTVPKT